MNDHTGYPWKTGDTLRAADLNSAIANAGAIAVGAAGVVIGAVTYGVVADYVVLPGNVSWNGTTVTVGSHVFTAADVGKYLIMPAGGTDPLDPVSQPAIVQITGVSGTAAVVDTAAAHAFSGLSFTFGGPGLSPNNITIEYPGDRDARVGDVLTALGGDPIRPGTFYVSQTKVMSATIPANSSFLGAIDGTTLTVASIGLGVFPGGVLSGANIVPGTRVVAQLTNTSTPGVAGATGTYSVDTSQTAAAGTINVSYNGSGGAPGPVYLRGVTGHGRRVILLGNVLADGTLGASLSVYDAGGYWQNIGALETDFPTTVEPMSAAPYATTLLGSWPDPLPGDTSTVVTISSQVHPSVLPYIHLGARVTAPSDTPNVGGIAGVVTAIDSTGTLITVSPQAATGGHGTGNNVTFTDNLQPAGGFYATFADNSTTIIATAALPVGVTVGQAISGPGIAGIGDPTDPNSTYITAIAGDGVTITISNETTEATVLPIHCIAWAYLRGVAVNLNLGVSVASYKDWGAYRTAPPNLTSTTGFDTTGVHLDGTALNPGTAVNIRAAGTNTSGNAFVVYGTDNTAAINAWLAAVRTASAARGVRGIEAIGIEAVLPAGCYLTLGSIDARNIYYGNSLNFRFPGVIIHSAAEDAVAWNAVGARFYRMGGVLNVQGDNWFPPDVGFLLGLPDTTHLCSGLSFYDIKASGYFKFAARVMGNVEAGTFVNSGGSNSCPPTSALNPNYGTVYDRSNIFGKFPTPIGFQSSFQGMTELNCTAVHTGGGVPYLFNGTGSMYVLRGYAASWAMPTMFCASNANPYLDIHCETGSLTDTIFTFSHDDPAHGIIGNPSAGFGGRFIDASLFATNSLFSYDVEGNYGAPIRAFGINNAHIEISPPHGMEIFDNPDLLHGNLNLNGDIYIGTVLYTASTHYHNRAQTRTGMLMLGDTATAYGADSLNAKTIVASDQLIALNNIQSQQGSVFSSLGFWVSDGAGQLPTYASLTRGVVSLGSVGAPGTPGTYNASVAFHGPGNTSTTPTHRIIELNAGTLDIQGNATNNAFVRIDGTLSIVAPLSLPNGSVAVTQAPGDSDTSVATTAFVHAAVTAGGTLSGPLGFWGTSTTINTYDAQISATGGATLPGNPGQGDLNYTAGTHFFKAWDSTTAFRVRGVAGSYEFWEADGGVPGTAATLRAVTDLNPDCDGAFAAQGHGSFVFGNGEGQMLSLASIQKPIINYLKLTPGGYNEPVAITAAGGDGLPCSIALRANYYGGVSASNNNGVLATFGDPAGASGVPRTSYFNFIAGMAGVAPTITLSSSLSSDSLILRALGGGDIVLGNSNGPTAIMSDPTPAGRPRQSYLQIFPGTDASAPGIQVTTGGISSPPASAHFTITALGTGSGIFSNSNGPIGVFSDGGAVGSARTSYLTFTVTAGGTPVIAVSTSGIASPPTSVGLTHTTVGAGSHVLTNGNGPIAGFADPSTAGVPRTSYFAFTPGASGIAPVIALSTSGIASPPTTDTFNLSTIGNGAFVLQNGNGRLMVVADAQATGTPMIAYPRFTAPSVGNQVMTMALFAGTGTNIPWNITSLGTGEIAFLTSGGKQARINHIASATASVDIYGAVTGGSPIVRASAGNLMLGQSGLATSTTSGMIQLPTCGGTPSGTPTNAGAGATLIYDNSAHKIWIYDGSSWRGVTVT